jgi:hypothetical protein
MNFISVKKPSYHFLSKLLLFSPVLIAVLVMLPRLILPQFGLLDDGRGLVTLEKFIHGGVWDMSVDNLEGRYRPMYWLWFGLFYALAGENSFWFFFGNMLALITAVAGLIYFVNKTSQNRRLAWMSGVLLSLSGAVIESYYTLSKGETLQAPMLILSLVVISFYDIAQKKINKIGIISGTILFLLIAHTSKETSIVIFPISLVWYIMVRWWPFRKNKQIQGKYGAFVLSSLLSVLIYYALRVFFVSWQMNNGSYTSGYEISLDNILASLIRWLGWLTRDYLYLLPIGIAFLVAWFAKKKITGLDLLLESGLWMVAWMALFLPWTFMAGYYLMPFSIGAAVFGAVLLENVISFSKSGSRWSFLSVLALGLWAILFLFVLLNNFSTGRIQIATDSANGEMLSFARQIEPEGIILLNIQSPNEYYYKMKDYLNTYWQREDLEILTFDYQVPLQKRSMYLFMPYIKNQPLLSVRMGVVETTQNEWNDSLTPYFSENPDWKEVAQIERQFGMTGVNLPRLFCPFIKTRAFCATPAPFIDTRPFVYGWKIYQLERP